jgi:acetyl esterase
MPLDSATQTFLQALQEGGRKPLHQLPLAEARAGVRALSQQLAGPLADVHRAVDRTIPSGAHQIGVRIYFPRSANGHALPVVLHYHGGGFVVGDLESHEMPARYYCRHADAVVINVDYRLAPEHPFPAAVDDCYAALLWAREHAQDLGADPDRIAVVGDSAGGNLSAVVCQLAKNRRGPRIAIQGLVYPTTDFADRPEFGSRQEFGGGEYFLSNEAMEWFKSSYLSRPAQDVADPRASPAAASDLSGLPPAVVVTAGFDPLRDEGKAYADRLAAAGVPVDYRCFDTTVHAFMSFAGAIPTGRDGLAFVAARLKKALHASA